MANPFAVEAYEDRDNRVTRFRGHIDPRTLFHDRDLQDLVVSIRYRVCESIVEKIMERIGPVIDEAIMAGLKAIPLGDAK